MLVRINTNFTAELHLNHLCFFKWTSWGCYVGLGVRGVVSVSSALLLLLMKLLITFCCDTLADVWICMCARAEMMRAALIKILNVRLRYCFGGLLCTSNICWLKARHVQGPVNPWLTCKCRHSLFIHFYPNINGTRLYCKPELKQMARFSLRPHSWHFLDLLCMWMGCREFRCN